MAEDTVAVSPEPQPMAMGELGYYESNGKQVPIQSGGRPFSDCNCGKCESPAPYPVEIAGDLFCSFHCAAQVHPDHESVPKDGSLFAEAQGRSILAQIDKLRQEAASLGVSL